MKAWQLDRLGGAFALNDVPVPKVRPGSVRVRVEAAVLMSYLKPYVSGELPRYQAPPGPFTPVGNAVGVIDAVGRDVWHLKAGQRVVLSSYFVAAENVPDPGHILIGVTSLGTNGRAIQEDWHDGTLAEYALYPVQAVTPVEGLDDIDSAQLAALTRCVIPYGGLLRGRLAAGESIVVTGATGAYGFATVLVALAMGAGRVIAAGRNRAALDALARAGGPYVTTVKLTGDLEADTAALRAAAGGGAQMAFDIVGHSADPNATLAALGSLRRGGRLVLMGGMNAPLSISYNQVMSNNLEIIGHLMHSPDTYGRLLDLLRTKRLDISPIVPKAFSIQDLPQAMEAAANVPSMEFVVIRP
jgi:alcohol dehydrogenase